MGWEIKWKKTSQFIPEDIQNWSGQDLEESDIVDPILRGGQN